ncbi:MAG: transporter [Candidatus Accumulibacter sp.]|uniref:SphA family protein n=1 Tax=Accumulibacter sp. TaxID=2053492 RepID=UPI00287A2F66|nr:transporter [Accumulibacter sp.]MDS4013056.1 transporter [Accumulibacter sp.]
MRNALKLLLPVLAAALASPLTLAKEGPDQYPNGAENFMAGALPPPGHYFINYLGYYSGDYRDTQGDRVRGVSVNATFDALRYVYVSQKKILGGDWAMHAILPLVYQRLHTPGGVDSSFGLGDITIDPLVIGWHLPPDWHFTVGLDIYLPTGKWSRTRAGERIGANYYSLEPVVGVTYLNQRGFEASAKLMYNIKRRNNDTDYESGNEFHMDYLVGQHVGPWAFGLAGYYLKQTSDDRQNGQQVGDGNRGQVFAYGPAIRYQHRGMSFIATWNHETSTENRFQGNKFFFKFVTAF